MNVDMGLSTATSGVRGTLDKRVHNVPTPKPTSAQMTLSTSKTTSTPAIDSQAPHISNTGTCRTLSTIAIGPPATPTSQPKVSIHRLYRPGEVPDVNGLDKDEEEEPLIHSPPRLDLIPWRTQSDDVKHASFSITTRQRSAEEAWSARGVSNGNRGVSRSGGVVGSDTTDASKPRVSFDLDLIVRNEDCNRVSPSLGAESTVKGRVRDSEIDQCSFTLKVSTNG